MARTVKKAAAAKKKKKKTVGKAGGKAAGENGASTSSAAGGAAAPKVWRPGVDELGQDEALDYDPSAYDCMHAFRLDWPCLSFDVVRDTLGAQRTEFPHTLLLVAGTQADKAISNSLSLVKLHLSGTRRRKVTAEADDDDDDDDEDDEDDDEEEEAEDMDTDGPEGGKAAVGKTTRGKAQMFARQTVHGGCVNRVRSMPQRPGVVASWADTGHVQLWDLSPGLRELAAEAPAAAVGRQRQAPLQVFGGHKTEGYAMDWSPVAEGRLATGDCASSIHVWEPTGAKWQVGGATLAAHSASVEDLQWSPTESNVLASCSVDRTVRIWDARTGQAALSVRAHDADVNVISWNRIATCMIASGGDDGVLRIWDLRNFKEGAFAAHFKYHRAAITSVEWSYTESSVLATCSSDDQLCVWDLALERDAEEEAEHIAEVEAAGSRQAEAPSDLPAQLLFVHAGQKSFKELHWHPQIPGLLVSTAFDGFNAFKPANVS